MQKSEHGIIGVVPIVLIVLVVGLGAFGIWRYNDSSNDSEGVTEQTPTPAPIATPTPVPAETPSPTSPQDTLPKGYMRYTNKTAGFSFAYPKKWGSITTRKDLNFNKQIVGIHGSASDGTLYLSFEAFTGNPHDGTDDPIVVFGIKGITKKGSDYILANNQIANNYDDFKYTKTELGHAVQFSHPDSVGGDTTQVTAVANLDGSTKYKYLGMSVWGEGITIAQRHTYLSTILSTLQAD